METRVKQFGAFRVRVGIMVPCGENPPRAQGEIVIVPQIRRGFASLCARGLFHRYRRLGQHVPDGLL